MFKKISKILRETPRLHYLVQRSDLREKIEDFLEGENLREVVDFKILSEKEIHFFYSSHSAANVLKMKEEKIREKIGKDSITFRYFLK